MYLYYCSCVEEDMNPDNHTARAVWEGTTKDLFIARYSKVHKSNGLAFDHLESLCGIDEFTR